MLGQGVWSSCRAVNMKFLRIYRKKNAWSDLEGCAIKLTTSSVSCMILFCKKKKKKIYIYIYTHTHTHSYSLLQGIFPTQGSNPGLSHYRQILYPLSHQRNPRKLEWVAYLFFWESFGSRDQTGVFCIAGGFSTSGATREAQGGWMQVENSRIMSWAEHSEDGEAEADQTCGP